MGECWRLAPTPHAHHLLTIVKSYSAALNVNRIKARKSERASPVALCVAIDEHHLHNRWKLPAQWQIAVAASVQAASTCSPAPPPSCCGPPDACRPGPVLHF